MGDRRLIWNPPQVSSMVPAASQAIGAAGKDQSSLTV
jgi:hypothetical protein